MFKTDIASLSIKLVSNCKRVCLQTKIKFLTIKMNKNSKVTGKVAKKTARVLGRRKSLTFRKGAFGQVGRVANTDTAAKELYLLNEGSSQTLGGPYSEGYLKETSQKNQTESLDLDKFQSKPTLSTQTSRYGNSYTRQSSLQERQSQFSFFKSN